MKKLTKRLLRVLLIAYLLVQPSIGITSAQQQTSDLNLVNLIVEGNETRTIRDTRLNIEGIIELKDNATLTLENVKVRFIESELDHGFNIKDNASLILVDSIIQYTITLNQDSSLDASNSKLYRSLYCTIHGYNHTTGGISGHQESEITLDGCNIGYLWLHGNSTATVDNSFIYYSFPGGKNLFVRDSTIQTHREWVRDSEVNVVIPKFIGYTGRLDSILPSSNTIFENVTMVDGLWLINNNSTINIRDSKLYLLFSERNSEITLDNVTLTRVTGHAFEGGGLFTLFVDGCNIFQIDSLGANDTIFIDHSRIGSISLSSYNLVLDVSNTVIDTFEMDGAWFKPFQARISHSTIGFFNPGLGNDVANEYYFHNVTLLDGMGFKVGAWGSAGGIDLHGEVQFGEGFSVNDTVVDGFAVINRYYPVFVNSTSGPVANVSMIVSNGNRTLWAGETNSDGIVEFPVRYVNIFNLVRPYNPSEPSVIIVNNITEVVSLSWSYGDVEGAYELNLLTDTPIMIEVIDESGFGNLFIFALVAIIVFSIIFYNKQ